jgi:hypothetical protein
MQDIKDTEVDERGSLSYWKRWLRAAKKARERHLEDSKNAYAEYEHQSSDSSDNLNRKSAPLYWSASKTLEPALYAKTPEVRSRRRNSIFNPITGLACSIAEKVGNYYIECSEFDSTMESFVCDSIHADKASLQVKYSADLEPARINLIPMADSFVMEDGVPFDGEVLQDEMGYFALSETEKVATNKKIKIIPLPFDEVLHTPEARYNHEITEKAYFFSLSEYEAKKRFSEEVLARIQWKEKKGEKDERSYLEKEEHSPCKIVEGWECWDLVSKKVYWVTDQLEMDFLDVKDDPYKLSKFFPDTDFVISSKPSKDLYPRPVYVRLKQTIEEAHKSKNKIHGLIDSIERVCLVDGANEELIYALNAARSGEYVAVTNLQSMLEKGGLESAIYWVPVKELVDAVSELVELESKFKADISEWFGVPDVLRGGLDPTGNAELAQMNQTAAHDRFRLHKKKIAKAASDAIALSIDMALELLTPEEIAQIIEFQGLSPEEQQIFPQALELLKSDKERMLAIDIDTDSMTFVNEQMKSEQMNQVAATLTNGFTQISQMAQIDPAIAGVALQALLSSLEAMPLGRKFQEGVSKAGGQLLDKLQNPPPPPPPPPDYEAMKLEIQSQKNQIQAQKNEAESMLKDREIRVNEMLVSLKEVEIFNKQAKEAQEIELKAVRLQLDKAIESFMMQIESVKTSFEANRIQLEEYKTIKMAEEAAMEENRLARESYLEEMRVNREMDKALLQTIVETQTAQAEQAQKAPPVVVKLEMPKAKKKKGKITFDEQGNGAVEIDEEDSK